MTKLVMETKSGHRFFVMKETRRQSDPTREDVERALTRSRRYTPDALVSLQTAGALFEFNISGHRFAFVRTDAPTILGGRSDGFWKVFQRRYGYKHAVHGSDRIREPRLWGDLVNFFSTHVEEASVSSGSGPASAGASASSPQMSLPRVPKPLSPSLPPAATPYRFAALVDSVLPHSPAPRARAPIGEGCHPTAFRPLSPPASGRQSLPLPTSAPMVMGMPSLPNSFSMSYSMSPMPFSSFEAPFVPGSLMAPAPPPLPLAQFKVEPAFV